MAKHSENIFITCISLLTVLSSMISYAYSTPILHEKPCGGTNPRVSQSKNQFTFQERRTISHYKNEMGKQYCKNQIYGNSRMTMKMKEKLNPGPFMAMLPKGFVPPSGSSACHNVYQNSITFFCDLSTEKDQKTLARNEVIKKVSGSKG